MSMLAVHRTLVSPMEISVDPAACLVNCLWKDTSRSSSVARPLGRIDKSLVSYIKTGSPCWGVGAAEYTVSRAVSCYLCAVLDDYRVNWALNHHLRKHQIMLRSMTAFGRSSLKTNAYELVCELRAVNHRYLDISIRLPEPVRVMEPSIRERLAGVVHRGKIDVSIKHTQTSSEQQSFVINESLLEKLTAAAAKVSSLSGGGGTVDPLRMLQWPGVMDVLDDSEQTITSDSMDCFEQALQDFLSTREREGEQISQLLSSKTEQLKDLVSEIRRLRPIVVERQTERWRAKFDQLSLGHDETRMEQELVYAAQRLDVDEELDRLDAHCTELHKALQRHDPVGRRLDFLMQEFNREANTLGAKSADSDTTNSTVDMKVLIEQMREQVQNVE